MSLLALLLCTNLVLCLWADGVLPRWRRAGASAGPLASAVSTASLAVRHALRCALIACLISDALTRQAPVFAQLVWTQLHVHFVR